MQMKNLKDFFELNTLKNLLIVILQKKYNVNKYFDQNF